MDPQLQEVSCLALTNADVRPVIRCPSHLKNVFASLAGVETNHECRTNWPRRTIAFELDQFEVSPGSVGLALVDALHLLGGAALDEADIDGMAEENATYLGELVCGAWGA